MEKLKFNEVAAVILAAGKGKRMKSDLPKVLHKLDSKYLIDHVIDNVKKTGIRKIVLVTGHKHELVREKLADREVDFVVQQPQMGTGHAIQMALPALGSFNGSLLVLCGDMPLVSPQTILKLREKQHETNSAATVLTVKLNDPGTYGRIVRDENGFLEAIVEYRDADNKTRAIDEVNTGSYCFNYSELIKVLGNLNRKNVQAEYYLTDTISLFKKMGLKVTAMISDNPDEGLGVNSQDELARMEALLKKEQSL